MAKHISITLKTLTVRLQSVLQVTILLLLLTVVLPCVVLLVGITYYVFFSVCFFFFHLAYMLLTFIHSWYMYQFCSILLLPKITFLGYTTFW